MNDTGNIDSDFVYCSKKWYIFKDKWYLESDDNIYYELLKKQNSLNKLFYKNQEYKIFSFDEKIKNNLIIKAKKVFKNDKFIDLLDSKTYLIGFDNGVYDFKNHIFRKIEKYDYIYTTCNFDYDTNVMDLEIKQFLLYSFNNHNDCVMFFENCCKHLLNGSLEVIDNVCDCFTVQLLLLFYHSIGGLRIDNKRLIILINKRIKKFEFVNEPSKYEDYYKLKHKMKHEKSKQTFINFLIDFSKN